MKPTVFLSHSSRDAALLKPLQELLSRRLGGSVTLFLSSDGRSIPFGRNWAAELERALQQSTLMFTFLSLQSLNSAWLYFEGGFAYARGAHVVPVALPGVDLSKTHGPISLLQGFNLRDHHGLNNLVTIINRQFELTFELTFTARDFSTIFDASQGSASTAQIGYVEEVSASLFAPVSLTESFANLVTAAGLGQPHRPRGSELTAAGVHVSESEDKNRKWRAHIRLSPEMLSKALPILDQVAALAEVTRAPCLNISLRPGFWFLEPKHATLAKLHGSEISFRSDGKLECNGSSFEITTHYHGGMAALLGQDGPPPQPTSDISFTWDRPAVELPILKVIQLLQERGVLLGGPEVAE